MKKYLLLLVTMAITTNVCPKLLRVDGNLIGPDKPMWYREGELHPYLQLTFDNLEQLNGTTLRVGSEIEVSLYYSGTSNVGIMRDFLSLTPKKFFKPKSVRHFGGHHGGGSTITYVVNPLNVSSKATITITRTRGWFKDSMSTTTSSATFTIVP